MGANDAALESLSFDGCLVLVDGRRDEGSSNLGCDGPGIPDLKK
jgi:hypothetical protein